MFLDPQPSGAEIAISGKPWQPRRAPAAGRRLTHDFLSLPAIGPDVQTRAVMRWNAEKDVASLIAAQFNAGVLRPRDVPSFNGTGDALAHGFFAWVKRHSSKWFTSGRARRLCADFEKLSLMLQRVGNRSLFGCEYRPCCAYAAATLTVQNDRRIGELLDSHYEYLASAGDGSTYYGFVPFAATPELIRKQYADWAKALSILGQLDRVIAGLAA
ncbi:hypothetical protein [Candidatus Burkholderia verschuerenii]|uniref:hypothetical protein n=1 Tax=Candidatus Burkholderia verschuerenii TaxID=242163 RepID=UPI0012EED037|nr:hypothetical protein [Candidatus Burkholderia verschuerenii]